MSVADDFLTQIGLKKPPKLVSPVPENDTLNSPEKLNYVAENEHRMQQATMSDGSSPIVGKKVQYPDWMANSKQPTLANGHPAVLAAETKATPTPQPQQHISKVDEFLKGIQDKMGGLFKGPSVSFQVATPQEAQAQTTPMPTQQPAPQNEFSGFTTTPIPEQVKPLILQAAHEQGVDPNVLASILFSEHGFITDKNKTPNFDENGNFLGNDRGVAQINDKWHPEVTDEQAFDPNFAINYAARLLAGHVKNFNGDYNRGIAAYNTGEGGAGIEGPSIAGLGPKSQKYVDKVGAGLSPELRKKLNIKTSQ